MIYFDFGRNSGCKVAGSKQEVVNKKVESFLLTKLFVSEDKPFA